MSANPLRLEWRGEDVAILWIDDPDDSINTLKRSMAEEFSAVLNEIAARPGVRGLVFASGKADNFLAGAHLPMLQAVASAEDGRRLSELAQGIQERIATLPFRTVAAIHGACLGGGLELVLAFDWRVASDASVTRLGLPEVQLGLLPGGGGTQRLPRLIGLAKSLDLMLTGRQVDAARALRMGLVDEVVPREVLLDAAVAHLDHPHCRRPWRLGGWLLEGNPLGRALLFSQARKRTLAKTRGLYPAPESILSVVKTGQRHGFVAGMQAEAEAFGELAISGQSRQLVGLFFAVTALKKEVAGAPQEPPVRKIGILGAGLMGAGIAYVSTHKAGLQVRLKDRDDASLAAGLRYLNDRLDGAVKRRRLRPLQREQAMARVSAGTDYRGLNDADIIIEAVYEDLELKRSMVREVERHCRRPDTIFASNTSALPISAIAEASTRPETVIGMHYFSPVEKMQLLEIVTTPHTADAVVRRCKDLGRRQGKIVVVVSDGPGFFTSRVLAPYVNEAAWLLAEGVSIEAIDRGLMDFGFPVGPLALLDEVGLDVGAKVAESLRNTLGERFSLPPAMGILVEDGRKGRKNGRGFYRYDAKRPGGRRPVDPTVYTALGVRPQISAMSHEQAERCALLMANEAARCLGEGIVHSPRDGDVAAVFGLGFPPFLGGPFRWLDQLSAASAVKRLHDLAARHGERFVPAPALLSRADEGGGFYG
ncbi:MAG: fatty acid oxidation complex subunit alpha FadJ [Chromatiales bacterium]|nr:fatty acid oxidation complex subunit alpha FadJ [Chromatiales bacterium]